jgi:hypothetical protein
MHALLSAAAVAVAASGALAAAPSGDWPCVQRKVPEVSLSAVWAGPPIDDVSSKWREDPEVAELVERIAARRTSEDEAKKAIAEFAAKAEAAKQQKLLAVMAGLFESLNSERAEVISGIERYGHRQRQMADRLREENRKIDEMRADAKADQTKLDELSDQLNWDLRIFDQRQQSLRFVCEVPVLIEQRLFALARAIQGALK